MSNTAAGIAAGGALGFAVFVTFLYLAIPIPMPASRYGADHFWIGAVIGFAFPVGIVALILFSAWKTTP